MRIALISDEAEPAFRASDRTALRDWVVQIACAVEQQGHQVDMLVASGDAAKRLDRVAASAGASRRAARPGVQYDVVHLCGWASSQALQLQANSAAPLCISIPAGCPEPDVNQTRFDVQAATRRAVRRADRIMASSPQQRSELISLHGADLRRIEIVPFGVDADVYRPGSRYAARAVLGLPQKAFVVLHPGPIDSRSSLTEAVLALLHADAPRPAQLLVADLQPGRTRYRDTVHAEISRLLSIARTGGFEECVRFVRLRFPADMATCYAAANASIVAPVPGSARVVALESMACGVPVIGTPTDGGRWMLIDHVTGLAVAPEQTRSLARCLAYLHANPTLAAAFGRAAMRRVRAQFTWRRVAEQLDQVYRSAVCAAGPALDCGPRERGAMHACRDALRAGVEASSAVQPPTSRAADAKAAH